MASEIVLKSKNNSYICNMTYIITYEDAKKVCDHYNDFNFSEHQYRHGKYKISTFDYFICGYNDFANPLPNDPSIHAFDMRGITFVFDEDGSLWNRYLMLPKFFNLNQVESTQYNIVKDKKIIHIANKEDGSLVTFMLLPNDKLFAKTIRGFSNDQVTAAMQILYKYEEHVIWVKNLLKSGFTPLFEYVSWDNRIVLKYSTPELRFIGIRDNTDGSFIPASSLKDIVVPDDIYCTKSENATLDELIERAKTEEDKEGWVVMFDDGQMIKIKTAWYFNVHGIRTESVFREDFIIKNHFEEKLDDIVAQLDQEKDSDVFAFIKTVTDAVDNWSRFIDQCVSTYYGVWKHDFNGDWGKMATNCHKEKYFQFLKFWETKAEYNKRKIEYILKETYRLKNARFIVNKWKNK